MDFDFVRLEIEKLIDAYKVLAENLSNAVLMIYVKQK